MLVIMFLWYRRKPQKVYYISFPLTNSDHLTPQIILPTHGGREGGVLLWGLLVSHMKWPTTKYSSSVYFFCTFSQSRVKSPEFHISPRFSKVRGSDYREDFRT